MKDQHCMCRFTQYTRGLLLLYFLQSVAMATVESDDNSRGCFYYTQCEFVFMALNNTFRRVFHKIML